MAAAVAGPFDAGNAEPGTTGAAGSPFTTTAPPLLTPDILNAPPADWRGDRVVSGFGNDSKSSPTPGAPKLPLGVNLGKFDLDFSAGHTSDVTPRTGFDSGELSNIEKIRPGKEQSAMPDYFGLKLSAPTH